MAAVRYGRDGLGLKDSVAQLDEDWLKATSVHLYLNAPEGDVKRQDAVVVNWMDGRLRLVGVRRMATPVEEATQKPELDGSMSAEEMVSR